MAKEDFTTYTELDEAGDLAVTSTKIEVATMTSRNVTSRVVKDSEIRFDSNFEIIIGPITIKTFEANAILIPFMLALEATDVYDIENSNKAAIFLMLHKDNGDLVFTLAENYTTDPFQTTDTDSLTFPALPEEYWIRVSRQEDAGSPIITGEGTVDGLPGRYGRIFADIYDTANMRSIVKRLVVQLHEMQDWTHLYAFNTYDDTNGNTDELEVDIENMTVIPQIFDFLTQRHIMKGDYVSSFAAP